MNKKGIINKLFALMVVVALAALSFSAFAQVAPGEVHACWVDELGNDNIADTFSFNGRDAGQTEKNQNNFAILVGLVTGSPRTLCANEAGETPVHFMVPAKTAGGQDNVCDNGCTVGPASIICQAGDPPISCGDVCVAEGECTLLDCEAQGLTCAP